MTCPTCGEPLTREPQSVEVQSRPCGIGLCKERPPMGAVVNPWCARMSGGVATIVPTGLTLSPGDPNQPSGRTALRHFEAPSSRARRM